MLLFFPLRIRHNSNFQLKPFQGCNGFTWAKQKFQGFFFWGGVGFTYILSAELNWNIKVIFEILESPCIYNKLDYNNYLLLLCRSKVGLQGNFHARIAWSYWFKRVLYYEVALVYVLTRLVVNVSQVSTFSCLVVVIFTNRKERRNIALFFVTTYEELIFLGIS